jgi:hypothetical protein
LSKVSRVVALFFAQNVPSWGILIARRTEERKELEKALKIYQALSNHYPKSFSAGVNLCQKIIPHRGSP